MLSRERSYLGAGDISDILTINIVYHYKLLKNVGSQRGKKNVDRIYEKTDEVRQFVLSHVAGNNHRQRDIF